MRLNSLDRMIVGLLRRGWTHDTIAHLLTLTSQRIMRERIERLDRGRQ